jgi:hypothetical protein
MVEVFKTDVFDVFDADKLVRLIHQNFNCYQANFDLDDCDHILRIKTESELIDQHSVISLLKQNGFNAEVLIDDFEDITSYNF